MRNVSLSVPHFEQSRDGYCLPACVRMVLAYHGHQTTEASLVNLLKSTPFGTPLSNVRNLQSRRLSVTIASLTREQLQRHLHDGNPIIVRVWTAMLTNWSIDTSHVAVAIGYNEESILLNDPAFAGSRQSVVWDSFLAAWAEFDERSIILNPS